MMSEVEKNVDGKTANYIPELANVPENFLSITITLKDEQ